jgi:hypothetical protein
VRHADGEETRVADGPDVMTIKSSVERRRAISFWSLISSRTRWENDAAGSRSISTPRDSEPLSGRLA